MDVKHISPRVVFGFVSLAVAVFGAMVVTSLAYLRPPTSGTVRAIASVIPYPAAVVGSDVITIREYLDERDALDAYFASTAEQTGTAPGEGEIARNLVDTLVRKSAIAHLARAAGIETDAGRVDAFYEQAVGGTGQEQFAADLREMFGWDAEEFRDRVVAPVVLTMQVAESIEADAETQGARRAKAEAALSRLDAGEPFADVAQGVSADASAVSGGDVGYVKVSDLPDDWAVALADLSAGQYTRVVESSESYFVLQMNGRMEAGEDTQVRLSVISIPKVTLEEAVQEYLGSTRVWRLIGRS